MFSYDLEKLTIPKAFRFIALVFVGLIAPLWYVFQFERTLFVTTDMVKLLIIGFAIGLPVIFVNFIIAAFRLQVLVLNEVRTAIKLTKEELFFKVLETALIISFLVFYSPIAVRFFTDYEGLRKAIVGSIYVELGAITNLVSTAIREVREQKKRVKVGDNTNQPSPPQNPSNPPTT